MTRAQIAALVARVEAGETGRELDDAAIKRLLDYDPLSGFFFWKTQRSQKKPGDRAGSLSTEGYVRIKIHGFTFNAHRLAWLFINGQWPVGEIDHINGNRSDNRMCNLRDATRAQNSRNRFPPVNSTSGVKGAFWHKRDKRWTSHIVCGGKRHHLGSFGTKEEAHAAYAEAARNLHAAFTKDAPSRPAAGHDGDMR